MKIEGLNLEKNSVFYRCVEDSTEAIMITNRKGILIYVNPAWQRIYEYSFEEAIGDTPRLLRSKYQDETFYKNMWKQILDPKIGFWRGDLVNQSKSGREVPVILTITPVKKDGGAVAYMGIALDMTEKKVLEAQLFQQDRLASIGLLASGVAHEIGTPLGIVRGRAELLKEQLLKTPALASGLDTIIQQIDRVTGLINNLLSLSRDHHRSEGTANVKKVLDEAISLVGQKFRDYGIEFTSEVTEGHTARISHNKLEQVIINLLMNAVHAIGVAYKNGRNDRHKISISVVDKNDKLKLFFEDTGCGIAAGNLHNIFRPFFTTKDVGEGTGLGLSVSYQIVTEAGGRLAVSSSAVDRGTIFLLELLKN